MLAIERKNEIKAKLKTEQRVVVSELAAHYGVTEETIRRDLDKLEREGFATKTYGGAIWGNSTKTDLSYTIRNKTNIDAKHTIGQLVSGLIEDGDHIMLDDSSTSLYIARHLKEKHKITVITNSIEIVQELSDVDGWTIMSTGGRLKPESLALVGSQAEEMIRKYHVDKAIISCKGLSTEFGITDSSEFHSLLKQAMIASAGRTYLAVDSSKLDKSSFVKIADLSDVAAVVTECRPSDKWMQVFADMDLPCIFPPEG
ncbi:MAG: DeoR/GlpR transcriptional regulator [Oscillospiraceae bacterium]|nr:DeoR/GlpR transcriptional regulator [Oscillospiraceae bacterium]